MTDSTEGLGINQNHAPVDTGMSEEETFNKFYAEEERQGQIKHIQNQISLMEDQMLLGAALKTLENNPEFKLVVEKGYIEEYRNRSTRSLGRKLDDAQRKDTVAVLSAVGSLQTHFEAIAQFAEVARVELPKYKAELALIQTHTSADEDDMQL